MGLKNYNCIGFLATLGMFILMMQTGLAVIYFSPNNLDLSLDTILPLNWRQLEFLIFSAIFFGFYIGSTAWWRDNESSSRACTFVAFIFTSVSWICMIFAGTSYLWQLASQFIIGAALLVAYSRFSLYLGEVVDPHDRGTYISIATAGIPFGIVIDIVAEKYMSKRICSSIYLVSCILAILLLGKLRESPYYLVKQSKIEDAKKSIEFYHAKCDQEEKLQEIQNFTEMCESQNSQAKMNSLFSPVTRKALFITVTLFVLSHISSIVIISADMDNILDRAEFKTLKPKQLVMYANIASVITTLLTCPLIDKFGRRSMLIVSSIGSTIAMTGLGIHFYLLQDGIDSDSIQCLSLICLLGYFISLSIGLSSIPSIILSELFMNQIKFTAALLSSAVGLTISFGLTRLYLLEYRIISSNVFWIHAVFCLLVTPYALFILPETKRKTFQEIQNVLQ